VADEYVPTLLQYAEVIAWLKEEVRYCDRRAVPEHLTQAYDDPILRAAFGRVAKAMQMAEDERTEVEFDPAGMDWL
jgi:hypothetical protein